jgi:anti-anti-sigma regulatory factor
MRQLDSVCVSVFTHKCERSHQQGKKMQQTSLHRDVKLRLRFVE